MDLPFFCAWELLWLDSNCGFSQVKLFANPKKLEYQGNIKVALLFIFVESAVFWWSFNLWKFYKISSPRRWLFIRQSRTFYSFALKNVLKKDYHCCVVVGFFKHNRILVQQNWTHTFSFFSRGTASLDSSTISLSN